MTHMMFTMLPRHTIPGLLTVLVLTLCHRTVSPTEVVRVELSPEVPVPGEPTLVTCTANVPDVRLIRVFFEGWGTIDQCTFDTRNNQLQIDCTDNALDIIDMNYNDTTQTAYLKMNMSCIPVEYVNCGVITNSGASYSNQAHFQVEDAPIPEIHCFGDCRMTDGGIEVYMGGVYQIVCSVYDAPPQISLDIDDKNYLGHPGRYRLDKDTCKVNRSIASGSRYNAMLSSVSCWTFTDPDGPALSNTTVSITLGNRTVTPYAFVVVDLTREVSVPSEPILVTCTGNVPDVRFMQLIFDGGILGYCTISNDGSPFDQKCFDDVIINYVTYNETTITVSLTTNLSCNAIVYVSCYVETDIFLYRNSERMNCSTPMYPTDLAPSNITNNTTVGSYESTVTTTEGKMADPTTLVDGMAQYIIVLTTNQPWEDKHAELSQCSGPNVFTIVCTQVQVELGNNNGVQFKYLGLSPTSTGMTSILFEAVMGLRQSATMVSLLKELINSGDLDNVQDSAAVVFFLQSEMELLIRPLAGPRAGGTPITISGYFNGQQPAVDIGNETCQIDSLTPVLIICLSPKLDDDSEVMTGLNITLVQDGERISTGFQFSYTPNPGITTVQPLETIVKGGVQLTVSGTHLNASRIRIMETTVKATTTGISEIYRTTCTGKTSEVMFCETPTIDIEKFKRTRRKKRQANVTSQIDELGIEMVIAFVLDGVPDFRNLTGTPLEEYSQLDVFANPVFIGFGTSSNTLMFTSTWPVEDKYLEIKGENLLDGLTADNYIVRIGEENCDNMKVLSNLIICEPPKTRPEVADEDYEGHNKIPVKIVYTNQVDHVGFLIYVQNLWEYPPGRYCIIGGICLILALVGLVFVLIICKRRQNAPSRRGNRASTQKQQNLVRRVKRWSRISPRPWSSFIPSGRRHASNFIGNMVEVSANAYKSRTTPFNFEEYPGRYYN